jgi:hypothetical protein
MTTGCTCGNGSDMVFAHADTCPIWNTLVNQEAIDTMPDDVVNQVLAILNKIK